MTRPGSDAVAAEVLRVAARSFITEIGEAWGGDSQWLTTGTRVAEVVACVLREMADDMDRNRVENAVRVGFRYQDGEVLSPEREAASRADELPETVFDLGDGEWLTLAEVRHFPPGAPS